MADKQTELREQPKAEAAGYGLATANVIVLAEAHNPSILSQEWLREHCGVTEEPHEFVHTPEFSMYAYKSAQIVLDRSRLQVIIAKADEQAFLAVPKIASSYIRTLPHIPYRAVGLNFKWGWKGQEEQCCAMELTINKAPLLFSPDEYEMWNGGIIYGTGPDHQMKVVIERPKLTELSLDFNFHYEMQGKAAGYVANAVDEFHKKLKVSQALVEDILGKETEK